MIIDHVSSLQYDDFIDHLEKFIEYIWYHDPANEIYLSIYYD